MHAAIQEPIQQCTFTIINIRLTDCDPGDLFVVRNVANLVAPFQPDENFHGVSAALEFSVKTLNVEFIIVLGHSHCGGIGKLMYND